MHASKSIIDTQYLVISYHVQKHYYRISIIWYVECVQMTNLKNHCSAVLCHKSEEYFTDIETCSTSKTRVDITIDVYIKGGAKDHHEIHDTEMR